MQRPSASRHGWEIDRSARKRCIYTAVRANRAWDNRVLGPAARLGTPRYDLNFAEKVYPGFGFKLSAASLPNGKSITSYGILIDVLNR